MPHPVPSSDGATAHGDGQTCSEQDAKNLWNWTGRLWNFDLGTFNIRTLTLGNLEVLFEGVICDIRDLSDVRRTGEEFLELEKGHFLCYKGRKERKNMEWDF